MVIRAVLACVVVATLGHEAAAQVGPDVVPVSDSRGQRVFYYEESHALIVGISQYEHYAALPGVRDDVVAVKTALEAQRFHVVTLDEDVRYKDKTYRQLDDAIHDFIDRYGSNPDARLVFYFAGHGTTVRLPSGRDMGYFLPADAEPRGGGQAPKNGLALEAILIYAKQFRAKHALFVFDSCFAGSIFDTRADPPPPSIIDAAANRPLRLFITSGAAAQKVPDKSVFREQFVKALGGAADRDPPDGYITGTELYVYLNAQLRGTGQVPKLGTLNESNYGDGEFVFTGLHGPRAQSTAGAAAPPTPRSFGGITDREWQTADNGLPLVRRVLDTRPLAELQSAARAGDGRALYVLGIAAWEGIGMPVDLAAARNYLRESVNSGFERALLAYGNMLYLGIGAPPMVEEAVGWWRIGESKGSAPAIFQLGQYIASDAPDHQHSYARARSYFQRAADMGHLRALVMLGDYAWFGLERPPDRAAALEIYRQARARGSTLAIERLAAAYREGIVYKVDKPRALALLREAAGLDSGSAAVDAAHMLMAGDGVPADPGGAAQLLERATDHGDWQATAELAKLLLERKLRSEHRDLVAMAQRADEHDYPEPLMTLIGDLRDGQHGWSADLRRAAELARPALERIRHRRIGEEGAWPVYQKMLAFTIQKAIAQGVRARPGEVEDLERRYGKLDAGPKRVTISITCGDAASEFFLYVWDAPGAAIPTDAQFEWLDKARGCKPAPEVPEMLRQLFAVARSNDTSFQDLAVRALSPLAPGAGRPAPRTQP